MKQTYKLRRQAVSLLTAVMLVCGLFTAFPADVAAAQSRDSKASAGKKETIKTDKENYLTDEQYEALGLSLQDPAAFSSSDTTDPLERYRPMTLSQLYMAESIMSSSDMKHILADNTDSLSSGNMRRSGIEKHTMSTVAQSTLKKDMKGGHVVARNAIALRAGDLSKEDTQRNGKDILIESTYWLWEDGFCCEDDSHHTLKTYYQASGGLTLCENSLIDTKLSDKHWLGDVGTFAMGGLTSMAVGDFDGDHYNEVAVHVATDDGGQIRIYQPIEDAVKGASERGYTLKLENTINVSDLGARFGKSKGGKRPVVDLNTTSMSGRDDLVISASLPYSNDDEWCNSSDIGIYSWQSGKPARVWNSDLVYDNNAYRFKFNASANADINGDGRDELIISGYKNTGYKNGSSRGSISQENLVNVILWDKERSQYAFAWEKPQTLPAHKSLGGVSEMQEPQTLLGASFDPASSQDTVFCEGVFYHFTAGSGDTAEQTIKNGRFTHNSKEDLDTGKLVSKKSFQYGDMTVRNFYIGKNSTALSYASDHRSTEQIAVALQVDYCSTTQSGSVYHTGFNGVWLYQEGGSTKQINMEDDILMEGNERYLFFTPVNVRNDAVYLELESKSVGWSNPAVYSVMTSMPYWQELDYGTTMTARGSTSFSINVGTTQADSTSGNAGLTLGVGVSGGLNIFGNGGGMGLKADAACSYTHSYQQSKARSETLTFTAGSGQDYVALLTTPIVMHNYKAYIPEHKATQADVNNKLASKVGDTIKATTETFSVTSQLNPVNSIATLSQYNKVAQEVNDAKVKPIKGDDIYKDRSPGDPTTYARDMSGISSLDEKDAGTFAAQNQVSIADNGQTTTAISLSESSSNTASNGFSVSVKCGPSIDISTGLNLFGILDTGMKISGSLMAGGGWGETWTETNTAGTTYTGTFSNLPAGTPSDYNFSTSMVKWEPKLSGVNGGDVKMADGTTLTNKVSVIAATTNVAKAPPVLPKDLRVSATAKNSAALAWSNVDPSAKDSGRPKTSAYQLYYSLDSAGPFQPVQKDGKPLTVEGSKTSCIADGLSPGTNYYFRLKSLANEAGKGTESTLSPYAQGKTKGSAFEPQITAPPKNCTAKAGQVPEFTITAKAQYDEDTLGYQWQSLDTSASYGNDWKDISGADKASYSPTGGKAITESQMKELDGTLYRCRVTEYRKGSNNYSIIYSKSAVLNTSGKGTLELEIIPQWPDEGGVVQEGNHLAAKSGAVINFGLDIFGIPLTNAGKYQDSEIVEMAVFKDGTKIDSCQIDTAQVNPSYGAAYLATWEEAGTYELFAYHKDSGKYARAASPVFETEIIAEHAINYELNGGTNSIHNPQQFTTGSGTITLEPAVKDGAEFSGWYRDKELKNKVETIDTAQETKDITLYAGWNNKVYKISYELNGGRNNPGNPRTYDADTELTLQEPSRNGYLFGGWYEDAALTKPAAGISKGSTGDKEFYAKWGDAVSYIISYYLDGGANNPDNPENYTVKDTIVLKEPTKANYTFGGWYTDPNFTNRVKEIPEGTTGNKTFFAKWTEAISLTKKSSAYQISSYADLARMAKLVQMNPSKYASASYRLTRNIDCKGKAWNLPIGSNESPFTGSFDGQDYFIANLAVGGDTDTRSLFGVIGSKGKVTNLSVVGLDIKAGAEKAGGLAAMNHGTIANCSSGCSTNTGTKISIYGKSADVSSVRSRIRGSLAGGLAGYNDGTMKNVRSSASLSAQGAGGIAGENRGIIQNISSMGKVSGTQEAGGFAAVNSGTMKYGYSIAAVSGKKVGALFASNTTAKSTKAWYAKSLKKACPDQSDKTLGASAVTMASMRQDTFCNTLNKTINGSKLTKWSRSASQNQGYPRIRYTAVAKKTLTHKKTGIKISGKMHADTTLQITSVKVGTADYKKLNTAAGKGKLQKAYRIKLVHSDGTLAAHEGKLTITLPKSFKGKTVIHIDPDEKRKKIKSLPKGNKWTIVVQSPGIMGQIK